MIQVEKRQQKKSCFGFKPRKTSSFSLQNVHLSLMMISGFQMMFGLAMVDPLNRRQPRIPRIGRPKLAFEQVENLGNISSFFRGVL